MCWWDVQCEFYRKLQKVKVFAPIIYIYIFFVWHYFCYFVLPNFLENSCLHDRHLQASLNCFYLFVSQHFRTVILLVSVFRLSKVTLNLFLIPMLSDWFFNWWLAQSLLQGSVPAEGHHGEVCMVSNICKNYFVHFSIIHLKSLPQSPVLFKA